MPIIIPVTQGEAKLVGTSSSWGCRFDHYQPSLTIIVNANFKLLSGRYTTSTGT